MRRQLLVAELEKTTRARTLDETIARNLKEMENGG